MTNDIAVGLRTPFEEAERIKKRFGVASARYLGSDDIISVPSVGGRRPSRGLAQDPVRDHRAAGGRDPHPGPAGAGEGGPRGSDSLRRRAHRRLLRARRHRRPRGGDLRVARAARGRPSTWAGSRTWCAARCTPPASASCSTASSHGQGRRPSRFRIRDESIFRRVRSACATGSTASSTSASRGGTPSLRIFGSFLRLNGSPNRVGSFVFSQPLVHSLRKKA